MDDLPDHDDMVQLLVPFESQMKLENDFFRRPGRSAGSWDVDLLRIFQYRPDQALPFSYRLRAKQRSSVASIFLNPLEAADLRGALW